MHSNLNFSVDMLGLSDITGSIKMKEVSITTPKTDFTDATVTMVADMSTINTGIPDRDKHLQTADFFDVAKYPTITFKSNSFKKTDAKNYTIAGDLTMHGITKPVTLTAIVNTADHPMTGKLVAGFRVKGIVKRSDFNISAATPSSMLSDEVKMEANLQFAKE